MARKRRRRKNSDHPSEPDSEIIEITDLGGGVEDDHQDEIFDEDTVEDLDLSFEKIYFNSEEENEKLVKKIFGEDVLENFQNPGNNEQEMDENN
jgi:hypothetical protein